MLGRTAPFLFVIACHASNVVVPPSTSAAPPPHASVSDGLVDVGGASLYIHCVGEGAPPVVLEAGLGNDSSIWRHVQPDVGRFARACASDRAGMGHSTAARRPHGNRQMARELHVLLERAGVPGPYVLVGHSMGGVNVRLLASEHPDDVAGMVLVDAVGEGSTRRFALFPDAMKADFRANLLKLPEGLDFDTAVAGVADMASSSRSIGDHPLVVLSQGKTEPPPPGMPVDVWTRIGAAWVEMQGQLCGLSSNCAHVTDPTSGHFVQLDDPTLVVASVREVVDAARTHRQLNEAALQSAAPTAP